MCECKTVASTGRAGLRLWGTLGPTHSVWPHYTCSIQYNRPSIMQPSYQSFKKYSLYSTSYAIIMGNNTLQFFFTLLREGFLTSQSPRPWLSWHLPKSDPDNKTNILAIYRRHKSCNVLPLHVFHHARVRRVSFVWTVRVAACDAVILIY